MPAYRLYWFSLIGYVRVSAELLGNHDQLVCIGGNTPDESYLNANSVLQVATMTGADALHPGIGFLSEDQDFAKRCQVGVKLHRAGLSRNDSDGR